MTLIEDHENGYNFTHLIDDSDTTCLESQRAVDQLFSYQLQLRVETGWTDLSAVVLNVHFDREVVCRDRQVRSGKHDCPFGCPIIYTNTNAQCYLVHRHPNNY